MHRELDKTNGELQGVWYYLDDGKVVYLAHRTSRQVLRKRQAWGFGQRFLLMCKDLKIDAIGVVILRGRKRVFYLTHVLDFFGSHAFAEWGPVGKIWYLPLSRFRVCPDKSVGDIEKAVRL